MPSPPTDDELDALFRQGREADRVSKAGLRRALAQLRDSHAQTPLTLDGVEASLETHMADRVPHVRNVADLRAKGPSFEPNKLWLDEYHAGTGRGGGLLILDPGNEQADDDGGTVFVTAGQRRYKRPSCQQRTVYEFGAVGDAIADDSDAIQAAIEKKFRVLLIAGTFGIKETLNFIGYDGLTIIGDAKFVALQPMEKMLYFDSRELHWAGMLHAIGSTGVWYHNRSSLTGIVFKQIQYSVFEKIWVQGFLRTGIELTRDGVHHNALLGEIDVKDCGAFNLPLYDVKRDVTARENFGNSGTVQQFTRLTFNSLPSANFDAPLIRPRDIVEIDGALHQIIDLDYDAQTIDIYPWVHSNRIVPFDVYFLQGAGVEIFGSNAARVGITSLNVYRCSIGLRTAALYGPVVSRLIAESNGIHIAIGAEPNNVTLGGTIISPYSENGYQADIVQTTVGECSYTIISPMPVSYNRVRNIGAPRLDNDEFSTAFIKLNGISIIDKSMYHPSAMRANNQTNPANYTVKLAPPAECTLAFANNTQLIKLKFDADLNRLFGYHVITLHWFGTGAGETPTGTLTIQPEDGDAAAGLKVMGGASYTITAPGKPLTLTCYWLQNDWQIAVAGYHSAMQPIADLNLAISEAPTRAEVQALSHKVDELLSALRQTGRLST